ncbi:hypothetical protein EV356DRAFT_528120 [Viridothelium virens]|uniref:MAPEG-domain-containing protein n=1 Tax=Viridothelium virens TaxID=1048519 RepID=A0A6A6HPP4_VIRVR|nr:hypothetical protein EV356DRAFT_528120 [Viridothelium virens]
MSAINDQQKALLAPAITLISWTFFMEAWMYATRLPAISKYNVKYTSQHLSTDFNRQIPASIRWKADNYNHLHEQPPIFYVIVLMMVFLSQSDGATSKLGLNDSVSGATGLDVNLAWTYVGVRVVHSLVQAIANPIPVRFGVFVTSSFVLLGLTLRTARLVF